MSILIISMHYRPEPNFIVSDIAERYRQKGHKVTVITTYPNYPHGSFYDGKRHYLPKKEHISGVAVWRLPHFPDHSKSKVRRFLSYISFCIIASLVAPFTTLRPNLVLVYQTPFTTAIASLWHKLVLRCHTVFIYADLWPESFIAAQVRSEGFLYKCLFRYSVWINRFCDEIIASTKGMVKRYSDDGFPKNKISYIPLWVGGTKDLHKTAPQSAINNSIVYAGNLGPAQNLTPILKGFKLIEAANIDLFFDIYGSGSEEQTLRHLAQELELKRIRFHGRVKPEAALKACRFALGQVVHLAKSPLFSMTIPSKLTFSLATGRPILAGLGGEAYQIAVDSGACITFTSESPEAFAESVRKLLALSPLEHHRMGSRGMHYFNEVFEPQKLLNKYDSLLTRPATGPAQWSQDHV
jgi:colanic acid biosynthesis glycosyl transferase WcaI